MKNLTELELLEIYAAFIEAHKINIAEEYEDWLNVCFACAAVGEKGENACHIISRQSNKYKTSHTKAKFRNALKTGRASGIGYIVNSCKKLGAETGEVLRWYRQEKSLDKPAAFSSASQEATTANTTDTISRARAVAELGQQNNVKEAAKQPARAAEQANNEEKQLKTLLNNAPSLPSLRSSVTRGGTGTDYEAQEQHEERHDNEQDSTKGDAHKRGELVMQILRALDACAELHVIREISSTDEQAAAALWGFVAGCSAITRNTYINYDGRQQHTHFYYLLCAPAASGKGILSDVRGAFSRVQERARQRARANWEAYKELYNSTPKDQRETIQKPKAPTFWLPADTSTSALISAIKDNDGGGCIWESEIDTINRAIKSDYGNYTDTLRNNYHGEFITYLRKTGREYIQLENTHFAAVIAGTLGQVETFFKSTENGLFSRWSFGTLSGGAEWADKFNIIDKSSKIKALCDIVDRIENNQVTRGVITFSRQQQQEHYRYYSAMQSELIDTLGGAAVSFLRRQALTQLRAAAVINEIVNNHSGYCCNMAWQLAASMAAYSVQCGAGIIARLPESETPTRRKDAKANNIYSQLPDTFSAKDVPENISRATYYRYIQEWSEAGKIERSGAMWIKKK